MKTTTRLVDYIQSELQNNGLNEFINKVDGKTQLTLGNQKYVFIDKMMSYDDDVDKIVTSRLFNGYRIHSVKPNADPNMDKLADQFFKRAFVNRFLNREIGSQTIEVFAAKLTEFTISNSAEIYVLATQLENYFDITNDSTDIHDQEGLSGGNAANATLPQTDVNLDLTTNSMFYADTNAVSRGFSKDHEVNTHHGTSENPDVFDKLKNIWEKHIWKPLDLGCFLQVFI